jgi:signal transduction histidine kinase
LGEQETVRPNSPPKRARCPPPDSLALLEGSSVIAAFVAGPDGRLRWANALGLDWFGAGEPGAAGLSIENWLPGASDRARLEQCRVGQGPVPVELELGTGDSNRRFVTGELFPTTGTDGAPCVAGIVQDVTAGRQFRSRLERSAHLEALGSLTSGVAHDFNNLLTILVGNLSLVAEELRDRPGPFAKIRSARDAARRGSELIGQLLRFARQEAVVSEAVAPARVIAQVAPLIERALGSRITLRLELDEEIDPIPGNPAQLESVIVNLAVNARDAIEASGSVCIRLQSQSVAGAPRVVIEVADDGVGMDRAIAARVFEPFFTTKPVGQGSGLGLSMVRAYAEQFGGEVGIDSEPGQGTVVRLSFPSSTGRPEDSAAMTMPLAALPTGDEVVVMLVAERNLGAMMNQVLSMLGYECHIVEDLGAAGRLLEKLSADLLISDGFDTGLLLASPRRPAGLRVLGLAATGSDDDAAATPILHKPFSLPDLALTVRATLDSSSTTPATKL